MRQLWLLCFLLIWLNAAEPVLAVDFQAPMRDRVCCVTNRMTEEGEMITLSFGRLKAGEVFLDCGEPVLDFEQERGYPRLNLCWSPDGQFCALVVIERHRFGVQVFDARGDEIKRMDVDDTWEAIDAAIEKAAIGKNSGKSRRFSSTRWSKSGRLQVQGMDILHLDTGVKTAFYEITLKKTGASWHAVAEVKRIEDL